MTKIKKKKKKWDKAVKIFEASRKKDWAKRIKTNSNGCAAWITLIIIEITITGLLWWYMLANS